MDPPKKRALEHLAATVGTTRGVLEVGFGDGQVLGQLLATGYRNVYGTEVSVRMVDSVGARTPELEGRLFHTDDPRVAADVEAVLCFEVLEHVQEPEGLARRFPGRVLYASVPNPDRWYHAITRSYEAWDYPPNHLHRFTRSDLVALLERAGYTTASIEAMPMTARDILMPFTRRVNVADYDEMRDSRTWYRAMANFMLLPLVWPIARLLGGVGFKGSSFYIRAVRGPGVQRSG